MIIVLMGAPGSGKGSQAAILSQAYNLAHISTGDILRSEVSNASAVGLEVKDIMEKGGFPNDKLILKILKKRLEEPDCENGFILDGFPRTMNQAVEFDRLLKETARHLSVVIEFNVKSEVIIKRLTGRYSCANCGAIYNDYFKPTQKLNVCDQCGYQEFTRRADDRVEVVQNRINVYEQYTKDVLDFYRNKELLYRVDASQLPEKVFEEVETILANESVY